jgi:hypothetical protein
MTNDGDRKPWSTVYEREMDNDQFLTWLQKQHAAWEAVNFPESEQNSMHSLVGMVEEMGELAHALLKMDQKIRGSDEEHIAEARDSIGDLSCIHKAWIEVAARDWTKNRMDGVSS